MTEPMLSDILRQGPSELFEEMSEIEALHATIAGDINNALAELQELPPSRHRSLVQTKLEEALLWHRELMSMADEGESQA